MAGEGSVAIHPPVLWAQRHDILFVTIAVEDLQDIDVKLEDSSLHFKGKVGSKEYVVDLEFFKEVNSKLSKHHLTARHLEFLIKKKEAGPYWLRLTKEKLKVHWLKTDFAKWRDEDESDEEGGDRSLEDMMSRMGGGFDAENLPDMDDIAPDENNEQDSDDEELPDLE